LRTTKRFTPALLRGWHQKGRGTGQGDDYSPWHQVSRGDPASRGRSHLIVRPGTTRFTNLLSDGELTSLFFAQMLPSVIDIVEQCPLAFEEEPHELGEYSMSHYGESCDGTSKIARELGIKHPLLQDGGDKEPWMPTTDLLIIFSIDGVCSLLAVADKPIADIQRRRTKQLLSLEREYWSRRGAEWLLLTPSEYDLRVSLTLSRSAPWVFSKFRATPVQKATCAEIVKAIEGATWTQVLNEFERAMLLPTLQAQCAFWQSVWSGVTPFDLRHGWRPSEPVRLLAQHEFDSLNPLLVRRSAWPKH